MLLYIVASLSLSVLLKEPQRHFYHRTSQTRGVWEKRTLREPFKARPASVLEQLSDIKIHCVWNGQFSLNYNPRHTHTRILWDESMTIHSHKQTPGNQCPQNAHPFFTSFTDKTIIILNQYFEHSKTLIAWTLKLYSCLHKGCGNKEYLKLHLLTFVHQLVLGPACYST